LPTSTAARVPNQTTSAADARRRIRKALRLFVDDPRKATIVDEVKLPTAATAVPRLFGDEPLD
jgi:hypothetical protein